MRMELIQPFINAADAVLAQSLNCNTRINDVSMSENAYRRKGLAARISVTGDIEGRIILDLEPDMAAKVASALAGYEVPADDDIVRETICELANLVIGNAVTSLNDQGYQFKVHPPEFHTAEEGARSSEDVEALVMSFGTPAGSVFMNVAMHYNRRRRGEKTVAPAD
jgi:chemotaxis protein CheX